MTKVMLADLEAAKVPMTNSIQRASLKDQSPDNAVWAMPELPVRFLPYLPLACRPNLGLEWQAAFSRKMISRGLDMAYWEAFDARNSGKP